MNNFLLFIGPYHILGFVSIYLMLLVSTLYLIGKNEKGWIYFVWLSILVLLPIVGPLAYLLKYYANTTKFTPANS